MSELALKLIRENKELYKTDQKKAKFLDLGNCGLKELPNQLFDCVWLERLNLGRYYFDKAKSKYIESINKADINVFLGNELNNLKKLTHLTTLDLSHNQISTYIFLEKLTNLTTLDLRANQISNLSFLEKLTKLTELGLRSNQISDIKILAKLTNLNALYLSYNQISDINILEKLINLKSLYLRANQISDISILEKLTNLKSLHLRSNQISDIKILEKLTNLTSLDLRANPIRNIFFLGNLTNLTTLDLRANQISDISFLENLTNLTSLDLRSNQISDISFLKNLTNLTTLDLRANQISDISFLENLTNLTSLDLRSNQISDIQFLKNLTNLTTLDLRSNQISDIQFLKNLTNLTTLDLRSNQISDIQCLENHTKLTTLDLSNNQINNSNFLEKLSHLITLDLSNNQITNGGFLKKLTNLNALYIRYNQIRDFSFLKTHINLSTLDLRHNQISDISFLEKLTNLTTLDLSENKITEIKALLQLLKRGIQIDIESYSSNSVINLRKNFINNPPMEIVKKGREAIIRYFEKIEHEGTDYIYEAKLTLVGEGGAGKTSLQRKLIDEKASLPSGDDRTRGIEVYEWEFKDSQQHNYTAHIWDFGGQDVYYPVHRFFLTENSVYILMASTRFSIHNFEYWIPTIYQFGGKSPIILVQNCDNGNQKSWEDVNIFYSNTEYNLCRPFYAINLLSEDNWGLKSLKSFIEQQIIQLPHIGKPVPKSWVKVREALIEKAENLSYISYEKFKDLCQEVGADYFKNDVDIDDLGYFLHDLGIILWYSKKDELKNLVILKPEWAMNAVYKIIDDTAIQEQHGIIHQVDFERIWYEANYQSKIHELKMMLQVFKIAFPKKHNRNDYILPARLLPILEEKKWGNTEPYLRLEYHFEVMPRGIVNQVSAELSKSILSDESVWNNAVVFKNQDGEAQMIEEYHNRKIQIKAKGRDARGIMLLIMDAVIDIIKEYRGVSPIIKVPCSCKKCQNLEKSTTFEYIELIELLNEKRKTITCNKSDTKLNIFDLLYSVGLEFEENKDLFDNRFVNVMDTKEGIAEIFFSYAWDKAGDTESREQIVKDLYESLAADGMNVILDKENLDYKGSISEFMNKIGAGDFIVVAISDAYLKSINCMYEFYEIYKNSKQNKELMRQRIFPIRVESISLSKPSVLETYFDYWEELEKEWEELIAKKATRIGASQQVKYKKIQAIASELGDFLDFLSDINSKSKEELSKDNFKEIKEAIKKRMND